DGGRGGGRLARRHAGSESRGNADPFWQALWIVRRQGILLELGRLRRWYLHSISVSDGVHGHGGDDTDRSNGRALEVLVFRNLRLLHVDVHLSVVRQLGMGRRLSIATRGEFWSRPWARGLRGIICGAYDGRDGRTGRSHGPGSANRKVHERR